MGNAGSSRQRRNGADTAQRHAAASSAGEEKKVLSELQESVKVLQTRCSELTMQLDGLKRAAPAQFVALQYNILASYLGDNRQPWFLYGLPDLDPERRAAILKKFYERGPDGKYSNLGWPTYVQGLLSEDEQLQVQNYHERFFAWPVRREALIKTISAENADLISLVELDEYETHFRPEMARLGYDSIYKKRPRPASRDGCGIFWRKDVFELIAHESTEFIDKLDPATGHSFKDRVALFALVRHRSSGRKLIFVSTHLARNPEDSTQTKQRALQAAQLLQKLTEFAAAHGALGEPVVLAGDLNTTNIRQISNIARCVFDFCDEPVHPFIFTARAPRTLPTSVTTSRKMAIDYLLLQEELEVVDRSELPILCMDNPIPSREHPSDHLPVTLKIEFKPKSFMLTELARNWCNALLDQGDSKQSPLTATDLKRAYQFFDNQGDNAVDLRELKTALAELGTASAEAVVTALERVLGRQLETKPLSKDEFSQVYLRAVLKGKQRFLDDIREAFAYFDSDKSGQLERDELCASLRAVTPFPVSDALFSDIFKRLDANEDGYITLDEFVDALLAKSTCVEHCDMTLELLQAKTRGTSFEAMQEANVRKSSARSIL